MKSPHVFHVYHTIPTSFFWGQGQSQASHQQDRHGAPGLPFRTFRAPGLPRTAQFTRARGAWHGRGQKWVKMVIYWWKDVERCGKMWKDVERCGKMWKNVERCGKMWKVKFIGSETFLQKLGDVGKASWKMVQSGCTEKLYHPHFSWLSRHTTGGSNLKPCNIHFVCCFKAFVGKTCCLVKITFWLVKTLILPGQNHDSTSKNYVVFGKSPWKHGIFSGVPRVKRWTRCRNLRLWKAPATRPILVGNVVILLGVPCDLVRESSPNGPRLQVKYCNLPSGYVKIAIENGHL